MSIGELIPTKLGRKDHWDNVYEEELVNFHDNGDEGEIWFGEESIDKMVAWACANAPPSPEQSILEVGSGNGMLLIAFLEAGYTPRTLSGIDYSENAVKLAKDVSETRSGKDITFSTIDFLSEDPPPLPHMRGAVHGAWDLILDKGTFDAIALAKKEEDGRSPATRYPGRVAQLLKPGGFFLITSCNFTEEELRDSFISPETGLIYHSQVEHETFTFAGKSGSVVATVAFRKKLP